MRQISRHQSGPIQNSPIGRPRASADAVTDMVVSRILAEGSDHDKLSLKWLIRNGGDISELESFCPPGEQLDLQLHVALDALISQHIDQTLKTALSPYENRPSVGDAMLKASRTIATMLVDKK